MQIETVYKIRQKSTGLYSSGGTRPTFTKKGKIWRNLGHLKNHLHCVRDQGVVIDISTGKFLQWYDEKKNPYYPFTNYSVIAFEITTTEKEVSIVDFKLK
jgi:hypothetical protein